MQNLDFSILTSSKGSSEALDETPQLLYLPDIENTNFDSDEDLIEKSKS
jgi:hypothetical protein